MTPSAESAPPSFDAILDSVSVPTAPSTQAAPEPPVDDAVDTPSIGEVEPVEPDAPVAAEAQESPEPETPAETLQPEIEEGVRPYGNDYRVTKPRMEKFVAANKFTQEIQRFAPTVEHAMEHYLKANDWYEMHSDFADPEKVDNWLGYWHKENPESFAQVARSIPDRIKTSSPQVYSELQQKFVSNLKADNPKLYGDISNRAVQERVDTLYDEWASLDPVSQKAAAENARFRAQQADFMLNGSYRNEVTRIDPVARQRQQEEERFKTRETELTNRQREIDNREEKSRMQYWSNMERNLIKDRSSGISGEIANALKPVEKSFTQDQLAAFKDRIENVVMQKMKEDFEWSRNRELDFVGIRRATLTALKNGTPLNLAPNVKAYLDSHVAYAKPIISEVARALIGQTTARMVKDNQAVHQRLASGQKPAANGQKPPTAPFKAAQQSNGKPTFDELFESIGGKK